MKALQLASQCHTVFSRLFRIISKGGSTELLSVNGPCSPRLLPPLL